MVAWPFSELLKWFGRGCCDIRRARWSKMYSTNRWLWGSVVESLSLSCAIVTVTLWAGFENIVSSAYPDVFSVCDSFFRNVDVVAVVILNIVPSALLVTL